MASRAQRDVFSLGWASVICVLVAIGFTRGVWWDNLHNGILGVDLAVVGAWLAAERPRSREGVLFLAAGLIEAVLFLGRQVAHRGAVDNASSWWGWLGVWPIALGLFTTTLAVVCFPDGHLPSPRWRSIVVVAGVCTAAGALLSALWPVEWAAAGLTGSAPFSLPGRGIAGVVWSVLAHPLYLLLQLSWIVAVGMRWRAGRSRAPLLGLLVGAASAFVVLVAGLVSTGSVEPGLITASLVPLVAGWSALHGHALARYRSLSWLTGASGGSAALPAVLARTVAESLDASGASGASVWWGSPSVMHVVGSWPELDSELAPRPLDALPFRTWPVTSEGGVVGALVVPGVTVLTRGEERMMRDLSAQATLLLDRLTLADLVRRERAAGHLDHLTAREGEVLELMAQGLTNAAICQELHLSVKTVEPLVSSIFTKLGLYADPTLNRRVLAAIEYHRG